MNNTNEILHIVAKNKNDSIDVIMNNIQNFDKTELLGLFRTILEADLKKDKNFFETLEKFNNFDLNSSYAQNTSNYLKEVDHYIDSINEKNMIEQFDSNSLPGNTIK